MDDIDVEELAYQCLVAKVTGAQVVEGEQDTSQAPFVQKPPNNPRVLNKWYPRAIIITANGSSETIHLSGKEYYHLQANVEYRRACHRARIRQEFISQYTDKDYK